jgi:hypothetical protein
MTGAESMPAELRSRWKSNIVRPAKITNPSSEKAAQPPGMLTKIITMPNAMSATSAQKQTRPTADRSWRVAYPSGAKAGDEQRGGTAGLPQHLGVRARVIRQDRR